MGRTTRVVTLGLCLLGASEAGASLVNGASCTPGDPAIQNDRYLIVAGSVNYKGAGSGLVTLYCHPVIERCPLGNRLLMTYTDSDGTGNAVSVKAQLISLSPQDGFLFFVPGAQILPNVSDVTVPTSQRASFGFLFDPSRTYTYIRVDMNRAPGTTHVATLYGVGVECVQ